MLILKLVSRDAIAHATPKGHPSDLISIMFTVFLKSHDYILVSVCQRMELPVISITTGGLMYMLSLSWDLVLHSLNRFFQ